MMPLEGERAGLELVVRLENCSHLHQEHIAHDPAACPICAARTDLPDMDLPKAG